MSSVSPHGTPAGRTLAAFDVDGGTFALRRAARADLPAILGLLAADQLKREDASDLAPYERAFDAIDADPAHVLVVGEPRTDAHRFYERLGFVASHEGMKLKL